MRVWVVILVAILLGGISVGAKTYRIAGRRVAESELRTRYDAVRDRYVLHSNQVVPAERVGAFPVNVEVDQVIDSRLVLAHAKGPVRRMEKPDAAPLLGARTGQEFTIAETNTDIRADLSKGGSFAVKLSQPVNDMPLTGGWELMLVDSNTYLDRAKQGRIKARDLGKVRVLYDVTIHFDDFLTLLQRGHVFPEPVGQ